MSKIEVEWLGPDSDDLKIVFNHKALPPELTIHKSRLPRNERAGSARELLLAAVAECVVEWVLLSLRHAHISILDFKVQAQLNRDSTVQTIEAITLGFQIKVADQDQRRAASLINSIFRRGCLLTRSVTQGIAVAFDLDVNTAS